MRSTFLFLILFSASQLAAQKRHSANKAVYLEDISWFAARQLLTAETVVVIPLGAGAKEHGPHLPMGSDMFQADYFVQEIARKAQVIIAPTITYSFYPVFLKYAGSTSLGFQTARAMVLDIVRTISAYGPKRFYVVNEGITTIAMLQSAQAVLKSEGILLSFSDYGRPAFVSLRNSIKKETMGGHASEIETANLLYIRGDLVDMSKAVNDTMAKTRRGMSLTPIPDTTATYSPSGIVGFAKYATKRKGKLHLAGLTSIFLSEIDSLKNAALPIAEDRSSLLKSMAGQYSAADSSHLRIFHIGDHLEFSWNGKSYGHFFPFYHNGADELNSQHCTVRFVRNAQNEIASAFVTLLDRNYWMTKLRE
jgi:creatinine amidohydrolase